MTRSAFARIVKITFPVLFGYLAIGIPFGLMLVKAGYPASLAVFMSVFIYAGAGQYLAVSLFASGAGLPAITAAMLLLNIRHIVYGLSLIEPFRGAGAWKPYLIFALTDETYVLLTNTEPPADVKPASFYGAVSLLNHCYWIAGTIIGAAAGTLIPFSFAGVDFALTALFAVLLIEQLKKRGDPLPPLVGAAAAAGAVMFAPEEHALIIALGAGMACLIALRGRGAGGAGDAAA